MAINTDCKRFKTDMIRWNLSIMLTVTALFFGLVKFAIRHMTPRMNRNDASGIR